MSAAKTLLSTANEWMEKVSGLMGSPEKRLDQTEKSIQNSLEKLRLGVEVEKTAAGTFHHAETKFRVDLNELGIRGAKQNEFVAQFREKWNGHEMNKKLQDREIVASGELAVVNTFIQDLENLPKLQAIIASAEPEAKWEVWLKSVVGNVPGLGDLVDDYFRPVMSYMGLGWLLKPKKKKKPEKNKGKKKKTEEEMKQAEEETPEEKSDQSKKEEPESKERLTRMTPKSTCFISDSITHRMTAACAKLGDKNPLHIDGRIMNITKGGMDAGWGIGQIKQRMGWKKNPFEGIENAVVQFGTNDMGVMDSRDTPPEKQRHSAEAIYERIKTIYWLLKQCGVKYIYAVTVPPYGGYRAYDRRRGLREKWHRLNELIRSSESEGLVHHVIDTCLTESQGGLADDNDPNRLSKRAKGDAVHPKKHVLAEMYQRELEYGTAKAYDMERRNKEDMANRYDNLAVA